MWRPIDTEFYSPRLPVSIVDVEGDGVGLRTLLEAFQCVVHLHSIGTPNDFLKVISGRRFRLRHHRRPRNRARAAFPRGYRRSRLARAQEGCPAGADRNAKPATVINLTCLGGERRMPARS